jgi:hypothetical protein
MSVYRVGGNKSSQNIFPSVRPTLDLDFANSKTLDPRITFTRASGGSYVGADGLIKYAGVNEARFDHDPVTGESLGLLIEESRTSLTSSSETFGSGFRNIVLTNQATAPDGNLSASIIEANESSVNGAAVLKTFAATTNTFTLSVFAKSLTTSTLWLRPQNSTVFGERAEAYFDLSNGNIGNVTSDGGVFINPSASIQKFNGGWYRCSLTFTLTTSAFTGNTRFYVVNSLNSPNVTQGASIYLWGAQLEVGAFPTSYIPTQGSTRTRAGESISITGKNFSEWYRQDEGTIFMDFKNTPNSSLFPSLFVFTDSSGPGTNRILVTKYTNIFNIRISDITGGITQSAYDIASGFKVGDNLKVCRTYGLRDYFGSVNGSNPPQQFLNVSKAAPPKSLNQLFIGSSTSGASPINAPIKRFTYFPKRLPNEQLRALTR